METSVYDIYFQGEALEGFDQAQLRQNMAKLFQANEQTLNALFSGKTVLLKKDLSKDDALKYQTQLKKAGARIVIKAKRSDAAPAAVAARPQPAPVAQPPAAPAQPAAAAKSAMAPPAAATATRPAANAAATTTAAPTTTTSTTSTAASPWSLSPTGADLLRPDERPAAPPVQVDISGLSLAAQSPMPQQPKAPPPPPPDTSRISIADVGAQLGSGERERMLAQAKAPDVDFSVADVGTRLGDEHIEIPLPEPDLSQFSLAAVGERLGQQNKTPLPQAPDTSHLSVAPQK